MKKRERRLFKLGEQELELTKVTEISVPKKMFILEELKDGTFRLTYSKALIPNIKDFNNLELIRITE